MKIGSNVFTKEMEKETVSKKKNTDPVEDVVGQALEVNRKQGQELIKAGLSEVKTQFNEKLVGFVAGTLNQITELTHNREQLDGHMQFLKDRIRAINDGAYYITPRGEIRFKESRLNEGLL